MICKGSLFCRPWQFLQSAAVANLSLVLAFRSFQVVGTPDDGSELSTAFNVHPTSGAITLIKPILDFEYQRMYSLTIVAVDHVSFCHIVALVAICSHSCVP